jgi:hypothetical protein
MKLWTAVASIVGVALLGCGCAATEGAANEENGQEEASTGSAQEAICRRVCQQQCTFFHGVRQCRSVCRTICN